MCIARDFSKKGEEKYANLKLQMLGRYGLGCAVSSLPKEEEFRKYYRYLTLEKGDDEEFRELLKKALPFAYPKLEEALSLPTYEALERCKKYFFGEHNELVKAESAKIFQDFCLAKEGTILEIKEIKDIGGLSTIDADNIKELNLVLNSPLGKLVKKIAIVKSDARKEAVIIDLLKEAKIGDRIAFHRGIACDLIID